MVLDKTGTLTKGEAVVTDIIETKNYSNEKTGRAIGDKTGIKNVMSKVFPNYFNFRRH